MYDLIREKMKRVSCLTAWDEYSLVYIIHAKFSLQIQQL